MDLATLSQRERAEANAAARAAQAVAIKAINGSTILAASAVLAILGHEPEIPPARRAKALHDLRHDYRLTTRLGIDVAGAARAAQQALQRALEDGYRFDLRERAAVIEAESVGLSIRIAITPADLQGLVGYPIQGHTVDEIAEHLASRLRYELDGALGAALGADPKSIVAVLGQAALAHANRLLDAVRAAWWAGVQAATKTLGAALVGTRD